MRTYATLILLTLCFACSSPGSTSSGTSPAGPESQAADIPAGQGRIYFFRKSGMGGVAIRPAILLNGQSVGTSAPGTYFYVDRAPGSYEVKCSVLTDHVINFPLAAGETVYVQTRVTMGVYLGHVRPRVVSESAGKSGVGKTKLAGSS